MKDDYGKPMNIRAMDILIENKPHFRIMTKKHFKEFTKFLALYLKAKRAERLRR